MPFQLSTRTSELRCSNCGRIITGDPIVVKTCCQNVPWVFCSKRCLQEFTARWARNQTDARRGTGLRRGVI